MSLLSGLVCLDEFHKHRMSKVGILFPHDCLPCLASLRPDVTAASAISDNPASHVATRSASALSSADARQDCGVFNLIFVVRLYLGTDAVQGVFEGFF